jgi:hypothetical protein
MDFVDFFTGEDMEPLLLILLASGVISLVTLFWLGVNAARKSTLWGMLVLLLSPVSAVIYGIKYWQDSRLPFLAYSLSLVSAITLGAYLLHASGTWQVMQTSMHMHQAVLSKDLSGRDALSFTSVRLRDFTQVTPHNRQQRRLQLMHDFVDRYESSFTEADREEINLTISRLMYGTTVTGEQKQQLLELQQRVASKQVLANTESNDAVAEETPKQGIFEKKSRRQTAKPNHRLEFLPITAREARDYVGKMFMVTRKDGIERQYKLIGTSPGALRFERRIPGGTYSFDYRHQDIEQLRILAQITY